MFSHSLTFKGALYNKSFQIAIELGDDIRFFYFFQTDWCILFPLTQIKRSVCHVWVQSISIFPQKKKTFMQCYHKTKIPILQQKNIFENIKKTRANLFPPLLHANVNFEFNIWWYFCLIKSCMYSYLVLLLLHYTIIAQFLMCSS